MGELFRDYLCNDRVVQKCMPSHIDIKNIYCFNSQQVWKETLADWKSILAKIHSKFKFKIHLLSSSTHTLNVKYLLNGIMG